MDGDVGSRTGSKDERLGALIGDALANRKPLELRGVDLPTDATAIKVEVWRRYDIDKDTERVRIEISYEAKP